jgi:hypothetical protein
VGILKKEKFKISFKYLLASLERKNYFTETQKKTILKFYHLLSNKYLLPNKYFLPNNENIKSIQKTKNQKRKNS